MEGGIRILLVEDDPGDALLLNEELVGAATEPFDLVHACRLSEALEHLRTNSYDVVLLDLNLPDSSGLDTLAKILAPASETAVVLLTGTEDISLGIEAVKQGAQDYLVKGQAGGPLLFRAIRYSLERKRLENERQRLVRE